MTPIVEDDSQRALTVGKSAANPYGITATRPRLRHPAAPMTRIARIVLPGALHHVTQRSNRRGRIFFGDDDALYRDRGLACPEMFLAEVVLGLQALPRLL